MAEVPADEIEEKVEMDEEEELIARHRKEKKDLQGYLTFRITYSLSRHVCL